MNKERNKIEKIRNIQQGKALGKRKRQGTITIEHQLKMVGLKRKDFKVNAIIRNGSVEKYEIYLKLDTLKRRELINKFLEVGLEVIVCYKIGVKYVSVEYVSVNYVPSLNGKLKEVQL